MAMMCSASNSSDAKPCT